MCFLGWGDMMMKKTNFTNELISCFMYTDVPPTGQPRRPAPQGVAGHLIACREWLPRVVHATAGRVRGKQ